MNPFLRLSALAEKLRGSLWVLPALATTAALILGTVLANVGVDSTSRVGRLLYSGDADGARVLLSTVAGSMITLTGTVFSLTVVALQIASGQFSPRLLRNFLRDRGNQVTLAVFVATFAYALAVLRTIRGVETAVVPSLAITVGMVLVLASIGMLVYFLHHLTESIRLEDVIRETRRSAIRVVDNVYPDRVDGEEAPALPEPPDDALEIAVPRSGYLQAIDADSLLETACTAGAVVRTRHTIGTPLTEGTVLAWAWPHPGGSLKCDTEQLADDVRGAVGIGFERTQRQDVALGLRQLADIAVKALSPGVNDPTTAVDVLGQIGAVLARLIVRRLGDRLCYEDGELRVAIPRPDYAGYLDLALGQIRRYGASEPVVGETLLRLLLDLGRLARTPEAHEAVLRQARLVLADAEREVAQRADLEPLHELAGRIEESEVGAALSPESSGTG